MNIIGNDWDSVLKTEFESDYFKDLEKKVRAEYETNIVFPPCKQIFRALEMVDYNDIKVVILGQDPYHKDKQANGLAFAVNNEIVLPPSLKNIYKEIESDLNVKMPTNGNLLGWAKQGVLLLNTSLTVRASQPLSHADFGWKTFTDAVIKECAKRREPIVFLLWGKDAGAKQEIIDRRHLVLVAPHPSPLSSYRGFFGSKHFSKANEFLEKNGKTPIVWEKSCQ